VQVAITFTPDGNEPYLNQATARGNGFASNTPVGVRSDDPTVPGAFDGTEVGPVYNTEISVDKTLDSLTDHGDGSFTAVYDIVVTNDGSEDLNGVQIVEDLDLAPNSFPAGSTATIISTSNLIANSNYDGSSDVNLLSGTDVLTPSGTGSAKVSVTFTPTGADTFSNEVTASGTGANTTTATSATNTPPIDITPLFTPELTITKSLDSITDLGGGMFRSTFTFSLTNSGNEPLNNVQLSDALNAAPNPFPTGTVASIIGSSANLNTATSYDGGSNANLLVGTDSLTPGENGTVTIQVDFPADGTSGDEFYNQANGSATGDFTNTSVTPVSDNPDTATPNDPTISNPQFTSDIEITKSIAPVTDNGDGTFTATYTLNVENTGNDQLDNVQITDAITAGVNTFPAGSSASITSVTGLTIATPAYDGVAQTNLLAGTDSLAINATGEVVIAVVFTPDGNQPYDNQATATAVGAGTTENVTDLSDNPATVAPDDATPADPPLAPEIALSKALVDIVDNTDGSFTANYTLTVTNDGNEPLTNIQVVDGINAAPNDFPVGSSASITGVSGGLTQNPMYDGVTITNLLSGNDTLAFGASAAVNIAITFNPDGNQPYTNQATVTAAGEYSTTSVDDLSDDPATAADGDGTETNPPLNPTMGITKELQSVTDNNDGSFTATFFIEVFNEGNEPLNNLQITDDLDATPNDFPSGSTATVIAVTPGITANGGYDGVGDTALLAGTDVLPVGGSRRVQLEVTFTPDGAGPYMNQATATSEGSASGTGVTEVSDDPADAGPTEVEIPLTPTLSVEKTFTGSVDNGDGTFTASYDIAVENTGNEPLIALQVTDSLTPAFPAGATGIVTSLTSGLSPPTNAYDGQSNINLLSGADTIAVNASETIQIEVTFTPTSGDSLTNTASGSAEGTFTSTTTTDDGVANPFVPPFLPSINVTKTLESVTHAGGGVFEAVYTIGIVNAGSEPLSAVQAVDNIFTSPSTFPAGSTATITGSSNLTANTSYDGGPDASLLAGTDTLAIAGSGSVTVQVTFTPDGAQPYTNAVSTSANGSFSTTPTADSAQTQVNPPLLPELEITKTLDELRDNGDGSFEARFTLNLTNIGNEPVNSLQVTDAVTTSANDFPTGSVASITSTSAGLTQDANYDGVVISTLLAGTDTLAVGANESIQVSVTFTPDADTTYQNTATTTATGSASKDSASDDSNTVVVDPDIIPSLEVSKNLDSITDLGGGLRRASFTLEVRNTGNEPLSGVQVSDMLSTAPSTFPVGSVGRITGTTLLTAATTPYNGDTQPNMLAGTDLLAAGAVGTISLEVDFTIPPGETTFLNQAEGVGTGTLTRGNITEPSDDPDTNSVDDDPTVTAPPFTTEMGVSKSLDLVEHIGGGVFKATYTITVNNLGNEQLNNVQLDDPISAGASTFPAGSTATLTGSTGLTTNSGYDGVSDTLVLTGTDQLAIGASGSVTVEVTFTPDANLPYKNQATGSGAGASSGQEETDLSDDPATLDDPSDPTSTDPPISNGINVEKSLASVIDNGDGTFTAPYTITVAQVGSEPLVNVSLIDSLSDFPAGSTVVVANPGGLLTLNPAYDGFMDTDLLATGNTLAVGASSTVLLNVTFTPDGTQPHTNSVTGNAEGEFTMTPVTDTDTAPVAQPPLNPVVTLSKTLASIIDNGDGTFTASFDLAFENTGNEPLIGLQIQDPLSIAPNNFPTGSTVTLSNVTGATANSNYDGFTDSNLLVGTDTLAIDASGALTLAVTFSPDGNHPYTNQATIEGEGDHSTQPVTATDSDQTTPPFAPALEVTKSYDLISDNGDGSFTATFTISLSNTGNEPVTALQVVDDLTSSFPTGATGSIAGVSGVLATNTAYDGSNDANLLLGTDTFGLNDTASITLEVTFTPDGAADYVNAVTFSGGGLYSDIPASDSATAAPVIPPFNPELTLEKTLLSVVDSGGGFFTATYDITVNNTGNEPLTNIQLNDAIRNTPNNYPANSIADITVATGLIENSAYDGVSDSSLLAAGNTLPVGTSGNLTVEVRFTPDGTQPYNNTVTGSATGNLSSDGTTDSSTAPAAVPPLLPAIAVTKTLDNLTDNLDGTFTADYTIEVRNTGNEILTGVQLTDALSSGSSDFPAGTTGSLVTTSLGLIGNTAYDGDIDPELLSMGNSLAVGAVETVELQVTFTPDREGDFTNAVSADGTGGASTNPVTSGATEIATPTLTPAMEVVKTLDNVVADPATSGDFIATFTVEVSNTGTEPLSNVQLADPLSGTATNTFPAGATGALSNLNGLTAAAPAYDGQTNTNLLTGTDTLAVGETKSVTVTVNFTAITGQAEYLNQITGSATGSYTTDPVSDLSDDTEDTTGTDDPTITNPSFNPELDLAKSLDSVTHVGAGVYEAVYTIALTNSGNEDLINVQLTDAITTVPNTFPTGSTAALTSTQNFTAEPNYDGVNTTTLFSGTDSLSIGSTEEVQVTVTFTPDGNHPYENQATATATGATSNISESEISNDPATADPLDPTETAPIIETTH